MNYRFINWIITALTPSVNENLSPRVKFSVEFMQSFKCYLLQCIFRNLCISNEAIWHLNAKYVISKQIPVSQVEIKFWIIWLYILLHDRLVRSTVHDEVFPQPGRQNTLRHFNSKQKKRFPNLAMSPLFFLFCTVKKLHHLLVEDKVVISDPEHKAWYMESWR